MGDRGQIDPNLLFIFKKGEEFRIRKDHGERLAKIVGDGGYHPACGKNLDQWNECRYISFAILGEIVIGLKLKLGQASQGQSFAGPDFAIRFQSGLLKASLLIA